MDQWSLNAGADTSTALVLASVSTAVLVALHLLAPRIRRLPFVPEHAMVSFAGGLAVSYVFLHLLPELAAGNDELRAVFDEEDPPTPLVELGIFVVALAGFCLFYALERLAEPAMEPPATGASSPGGEPDRRGFWVHLAGFGVYNAVITYSLSSTYRTGVAFAALFTLAMGLHFVLSDRALERHYGRLFDRWTPRVLLSVALVVGWGLAAVFAPTRSVTISVLTAFLAGSVLLNVVKEEIPSARRTSLPWFMTGLLAYALLLGLLRALG